MATTRRVPTKPWRLRIPDAKDTAVLAALYEARVLTAPQLQRLYGLESVGSLHPRLQGLLGPEGTPRVLERGRAPDGRYFYAVGSEGYATLGGDLPRHKPLARLRLSAQFTDHAQAVGWLLVTWLLAGEEAGLPPESARTWWGERRAMLPYPLRQPKGAHTQGRVEPDGVMILTLADGARWCGAVEHDQGTEDSADWAGKLGRWAAAIRADSWQARYGATSPHLLITVPTAARRAQIAPWVAAGRSKHGHFFAWIAEHPGVALGEADPPAVAAERVAARVWQQVSGDPDHALLPDRWQLPGIIAATAPWRPDAEPAPAARATTAPHSASALPPAEAEVARLRAALIEQETRTGELARQVEYLRGEREQARQQLGSAQVDNERLTGRYRQTLAALIALQAAQPRARLRRFWTPPQLWRLALHSGLAWAGILAGGLLLPVGWLLAVQLWAAAQDFDPMFATLVASGVTGRVVLIHLVQVPWCGGLLLLASILGTAALARWARQVAP